MYFDYDVFLWRFDPLLVQAHLSESGVDAYLSRIQATLPPEVLDLLQVMACLPVSGARPELLADFLNTSESDVNQMMQKGQGIGALVATSTGSRFSHDRQRVSQRETELIQSSAYNSLSSEQAGKLHFALAQFFGQAGYIEDHSIEAADHLISARSLDVQISNPVTMVEILLHAATRSAFAASFSAGKAYADVVEGEFDCDPADIDIMNESGGLTTWFTHSRGLCFRHAELVSQLCGVLGLYNQAFIKVSRRFV